MREHDPLTPADCDLRQSEPPWDLFVKMAMAQFGTSHEDAQAYVDEARRAYWRERAGEVRK